MDFYGGCLFCDKAVDCYLAGKPAADCPVAAMIKAKADLKQALMETKLLKAMGWIVDKLEEFLEKM